MIREGSEDLEPFEAYLVYDGLEVEVCDEGDYLCENSECWNDDRQVLKLEKKYSLSCFICVSCYKQLIIKNNQIEDVLVSKAIEQKAW